MTGATRTTGRQALAARLGGDEFAVITALREQLYQPVTHDGLTLHMTVSLGIARAADLPGEDPSRQAVAAP
ncbi:hypothetical protein ACIPM2_31680 [Streptomyces sp. NPDC086081]|uniref:hypothetical protein n=1 Tax=Streptomyces sp. NPDC086081 TaxID=3365749 RepID=UPI00382F78D3